MSCAFGAHDMFLYYVIDILQPGEVLWAFSVLQFVQS